MSSFLSSRSSRVTLVTQTFLLALLMVMLGGCAPKETSAPRASEQMQGGGPPAPESHRPASAPKAP